MTLFSKDFELALNAKNHQLNAIYNNFDLKAKNTLPTFTDLGAGGLNGQLLLMMLQNQPVIQNTNPFAVGNVNLHGYTQGLQANNIGIYTQDFKAYQPLLFADAGNVFNQNLQPVYANNLLDNVIRTNQAGIQQMDDRGKLHTLLANAINDTSQNRNVVNQKTVVTQSHSVDVHANHLVVSNGNINF